MPSKRPERVSGLLLQAVAEILLREVKDPRINGITPTAASISPDLKEAKVFFRTLRPDELTDAQAGLSSAAGYIRRQISIRLRLRRTPLLRFVYDTSIDQASHMESLLQQARDMSPDHIEPSLQDSHDEDKPECLE